MISYFGLKMMNYTFLLMTIQISCTEKSLEKLIKSLTSKPEKAVQWFKENMMIVNHAKFQAIIIDRKNQQANLTSIKINDTSIKSENWD